MFFKTLLLSMISFTIFASDFGPSNFNPRCKEKIDWSIVKKKLSEIERSAFDIWMENRSLSPNLKFFVGLYVTNIFVDDYRKDLLRLIKQLLLEVPSAYVQELSAYPKIEEFERELEQGRLQPFIKEIDGIVLVSGNGRYLTMRTPEGRVFNCSFHPKRKKWLWCELVDPDFEIIPGSEGKKPIIKKKDRLIVSQRCNKSSNCGMGYHRYISSARANSFNSTESNFFRIF